MAYSQVAYTADGVNPVFAVPFPYLDQSHVSATVNGVSATFAWLTDSTIQMDAIPTAGQTVFISRSSNRQARLVHFQDSTVLTETAIEEDANQLFYIAQEAFDAVAAGNGIGDMLRANNLSDVLSISAARANLGAAALAGATFTGAVSVPTPTIAAHAATKGYVDSAVAGSVTGVSSFNGRTGAVSPLSADVTGALGFTPANKAGDTFTGPVFVPAPTALLHAATKQYVDTLFASATGEVNTASNLGAGNGVYSTKVGADLRFKSLIAGAGVTLTPTGTDITIAATAVGGGEVNDGLNIGVTGLGPYASKSGVHLQFKGIAAGNGLLQLLGGTDNTYSVNQAYPFVWAAQHKFNATTGEVTPPAIMNMPGLTKYAAKFSRNAADVGTTNDINAALMCHTKVAVGHLPTEWNAIFTIEDHTAGTVGNVGQYTKASKYSSGAIWGGVFESQDYSGDMTSSVFGLEIDLCVTGVDNSGFKRGISIFYGDCAPNTFNTSGAATKAGVGMEIAPFVARNALKYGYTVNGTVDYGFLSATNMGTGGISAFAATGTYSSSVWEASGAIAPYSLAMAGGSALHFASGTAGNPTGAPTWYPGNFTPTWFGAVRIVVDGTTLYIPVCSNHP